MSIEIKRPCFVKVDAEGGDLQVLEGFGKKLNEVDLIQVEFNEGENYKEIMELLNKFGFIHFLQVGFRSKTNKSDLIFKR